jgi:hypothetical protein
MNTAKVKRIDLNNTTIVVEIDAANSIYVEQPKMGSPRLLNGGPLVEGFNLVLAQGHHAVEKMKGETTHSAELTMRIKQLLSALNYESLTDYQAKIVLLVEKELKALTNQ